MRLTILGCGTSTGVPIPGCPCAVCNSNDPKNERWRTSALITADDGRNILIDTSPDLHHQALRYKIERVDAVLYTHAHADHILGTDDLRVYNFRRDSPIPCFGDAQTLSALKNFFHYIFSPDPNYEGGLLAKLALHEIEVGKSFKAAEQEVLPFSLLHGSSPVLGFRIGDLAYATDCNAIPDESFSALSGVKVLILDALRHKPHNTHFTVADAVDAAKRVGAERTYFVHMTHDLDYHETNAELPPGMQLAYDGLQIDF